MHTCNTACMYRKATCIGRLHLTSECLCIYIVVSQLVSGRGVVGGGTHSHQLKASMAHELQTNTLSIVTEASLQSLCMTAVALWRTTYVP